MHYSELRKSISENNVIQKEMKLLDKCIEFIINNNIKSIIKIYIEFIDIDNNKELLNINMRFEYFELGLYDQMKISEIDKLLKIVN